MRQKEKGQARPLVALLICALLTGCASSGFWTIAFGKDAKARIWRPDYCQTVDGEKRTEHTIDRTIGADEKIVTTEPATVPPMSESEGGEVPKLGIWAGIICLFTSAC